MAQLDALDAAEHPDTTPQVEEGTAAGLVALAGMGVG